MHPNDLIRVLIVGESPQELFASQELYELNNCRCQFARSLRDVAQLPDLLKFDIVLSSALIPGDVRELIALLAGSHASLFCSLRVEQGYWWMPVLNLGKECFGTLGFRPGDFVKPFVQLVKNLKANVITPSWYVK